MCMGNTGGSYCCAAARGASDAKVSTIDVRRIIVLNSTLGLGLGVTEHTGQSSVEVHVASIRFELAWDAFEDDGYKLLLVSMCDWAKAGTETPLAIVKGRLRQFGGESPPRFARLRHARQTGQPR